MPPRQRSKHIDDAKARYSRILDRLATGATDLGAEEKRVLALWPQGTHKLPLEQASEEVRFQLGQSDRFREGILRSGAYRAHIADTFERPDRHVNWPHCRTSSHRSILTLTQRSGQLVCGNSCALRAGASCGSIM